MRKTSISKFSNNVNVYYTNEKVVLPENYINKVEKHWKALLDSGKIFFRGDIFTIVNIEEKPQETDIFVELTDYAHFLYTVHKNLYEEHDCRVIHTSVLIETKDRKFVIGEMSTSTAFPNRLQFIGGGIDKGDINGNRIDLEHSIRKEIFEEIGIDTKDRSIVKELVPCYLKSGGENNFLSAIFKMNLLIDENELINMFRGFKQKLISKGSSPEINSLIFINSDLESVEEFVKDDLRKKDGNVIPTLKAASGIDLIDSYII